VGESGASRGRVGGESVARRERGGGGPRASLRLCFCVRERRLGGNGERTSLGKFPALCPGLRFIPSFAFFAGQYTIFPASEA
jgi:hypothetical protein